MTRFPPSSHMAPKKKGVIRKMKTISEKDGRREVVVGRDGRSAPCRNRAKEFIKRGEGTQSRFFFGVKKEFREEEKGGKKIMASSTRLQLAVGPRFRATAPPLGFPIYFAPSRNFCSGQRRQRRGDAIIFLLSASQFSFLLPFVFFVCFFQNLCQMLSPRKPSIPRGSMFSLRITIFETENSR